MITSLRSLHDSKYRTFVVSAINILAIIYCSGKLWLTTVQVVALSFYWYAEYRRRHSGMMLFGSISYALCKAGDAELPNEVLQIYNTGQAALRRLLYVGPAVICITISIVLCDHTVAYVILSGLNGFLTYYLFRVFLILFYVETDMKDIAQNLYRLFGHITENDYKEVLFNDKL